MKENLINRLISKIIDGLAGDSEVTESVQNNLDFSQLDYSQLAADPDVWQSLKKLVVEAIDNIDLDEDTDRQADIWNYARVEGLIRNLCRDDAQVRETLENKLRELITDHIGNLDPEDDDDLNSSIDETVDDWIEDNLNQLVNQDEEVRTSLKTKLIELINNHLDNLDESQIAGKLDAVVLRTLISQDLVQEIIAGNTLARKSLEDKLLEVIIERLDDLVGNEEILVRLLSESPPLVKMVDETVQKMLLDPQRRELVLKAVQNIMQNPEKFEAVVAGSLSKMLSEEQ